MKNIVYLLLSIIFYNQNIQAQIVYVNGGASGANDGTSWTNAYTDLTDALLNTSTGEIWVAQGSYSPTKDFSGFTPASNELKTFKVPSGVQVYGGFNGTETMLSQRDWRSNLTILEGDFGGGKSLL